MSRTSEEAELVPLSALGDDVEVVPLGNIFNFEDENTARNPDMDYERFYDVGQIICCSREACLIGWKTAGKVVYGIGHITIICAVDGFEVEELVEFIIRREVETWGWAIGGIAVSVVAQAPIVVTILYHWEAEHHHEHSILGHIKDVALVAGPFVLRGSAAVIDFMEKFHTCASATTSAMATASPIPIVACSLPFGYKFISLPFAFFYGFAALKLHGFFIHEAEHLEGGGRGAFFRALYRTLFRQGWKLFFWKLAIFAGHAGAGYFDARVFTREWGIDEAVPTLAVVIKIALPVACMFVEGFSHAFALDQLLDPQNQSRAMRGVYVIVFISGIFHVAPELTGMAELLLNLVDWIFHVDDWIAATICLGAVGALLGPADIAGYIAMTIGSFNDMFGQWWHNARNYLRPGRQAEDHADINRRELGLGHANDRQRLLGRPPEVEDGEERQQSRCGIM